MSSQIYIECDILGGQSAYSVTESKEKLKRNHQEYLSLRGGRDLQDALPGLSNGKAGRDKTKTGKRKDKRCRDLLHSGS